MTMEGAYPYTERAELIYRESIDQFLTCLFSRVHFGPAHFIDVRGIGEKGTDKEGVFSEDCWTQPALWEDPEATLLGDVTMHCERFAQYNIASYIVPAILKESRGTSDAVSMFPAALVDLDTGDTFAKATHLGKHLGEPTMAVASGGTTDMGTPKLHLYWVFDEPSADIGKVVDLRHELARKVGGDLQFGRGTPDNPFGRAHQPIRIPGSVHSKGNKPQRVTLLKHDGPVYDADMLAESVRRMPESPWAIAPQAAATLDFSAFGPELNQRQNVGSSLLQEVHEGGIDKTRWSEFSKVAGLHIAEARKGEISIEDALARTHGWVLGYMVPPWPEARVQREFNALVAVDEQKYGVLPAAAEPAKTTVTDETLGLRQYRVANWAQGEPPVRQFLVDGLVLAGKPHLLVAEGGAGKTFAALDLGMKIATREPGEEMEWMGRRIVCDTGTTVMLTTEDDMDELHIRVNAIDPNGRRFAAGDRWIVVPAVNTERGPFTFGERDKATGNVVPSGGWREFVGWLEKLPNVKLVIVDTLNTTLHGEENSATVVNEYAKLLAPVCGRIGSALLVTHHIRKQDTKFPIKNADDMAAAVRGSSALPAAFRAVLGIWHCHNFGKVMESLGMEPKKKSVWQFAVLKANNPEMMESTRYLLRDRVGILNDVTDRVMSSMSGADLQKRAWLIAAVEQAANAGVPFRKAAKSSQFGPYGRKNELHPTLREGARTGLGELVDQLIDAGDLEAPTVEHTGLDGKIKRYEVLDVPDGRYTGKKPPRVDEGDTWKAPDWESAWRFDATLGRAVPTNAPKMAMKGVS